MALLGMHHVAQKSTSTGVLLCRTAVSHVVSVTSSALLMVISVEGISVGACGFRTLRTERGPHYGTRERERKGGGERSLIPGASIREPTLRCRPAQRASR